MTALVLMTLLAGEPDPLADPDDAAEAEDETVDGDLAALADAERQEEWIVARARAARGARANASYWPRIALSISAGDATAPALDRSAGVPPRWRLAASGGLVWSILATWGAP